MAMDVTLSAEARQNLNSIQRTDKLLDRTQSRLATGRKVNSAVDDAVAFFQGRALEDRAKDLMGVKDAIAGGVSTIKAAMDGLEAVEHILTQMKGIALIAKSEEKATVRQAYYEQYSELRAQLDTITADSDFNGANLIGNPAADVKVTLSPPGVTPVSSLTVPGVSTNATTLSLFDSRTTVTAATYASTPAIQTAMDGWVQEVGTITAGGGAYDTGVIISGFPAFKALDAYAGGAGGIGTDAYIPLYSDANGDMSFDEANFVDASGHTTGEWQYKSAQVLQDYMSTGGTLGANIGNMSTLLNEAVFTSGNYPGISVSIPAHSWMSDTSYSANIQFDIDRCEAAINTVRSTMAEMGSNIAILEVRDSFTKSNINNLQEGAAKLLNADVNEEGANMIALQTRSQLALQALSFSGKTADGIMSLFR